MEITSGSPIQIQTEVLKKADDVQEQAVSRLIQNDTAQLKEQQKTVEDTQKPSASALTGLGMALDLSV
ncbi:MAG TPA: hypothetical protein EYO73_09935 [Sulfurimonas sp.]|nr:hypothetical protein [Sulfurimonas sp.]